MAYVVTEELLILIFKVINDLIKNNYDAVQLHSTHSYGTRRGSQYNIEFFSTEICHQNIYYKGFSEYNKLPSYLRHCDSLKLFKFELNKYLKTKLLLHF